MVRYCGKGALMMVVAGLLSACSLVSPSQPVQHWAPTPAPVDATLPVQLSGLRILRPQAADLLNGRYMLVQPPGEPISIYSQARWSAPIPALWRDYLIDALQRDGRFAQVSGDLVRLDADYELVSRLDAFQTEYRAGQPEVVMRAYLQLVAADSRTIIAERRLELSQPAESPQVAAVVDAFSSLLARASGEIAQWLLSVAGSQP